MSRPGHAGYAAYAGHAGHAGHAAAPPPASRTPARAALLPSLVLALIVLASAAQTEAASHLSTVQAYDRPYLAFYLTHSTFALVLPAHLAVLAAAHGPRAVRAHLAALAAVLADQVAHAPPLPWRRAPTLPTLHTLRAPAYAAAAGAAAPGPRFPFKPWATRIALLTVLISVPALSWYVSMALAPPLEVTTLYATSAFHAYFCSMALLGARLSRATAGSIAVAFAGVVVMTLGAAGDAGGSGGAGDGAGDGDGDSKWAGRLTGDVIMAVGAAMLGLYEVVYKILLPSAPAAPARARTEAIPLRLDRRSSRTPLLKPADGGVGADDDEDEDGNEGGDGDEGDDGGATEGRGRAAARRADKDGSADVDDLAIADDSDSDDARRSLAARLSPTRRRAPSLPSPSPAPVGRHARAHAAAPSSAAAAAAALPPALHANALTAAIGLATLALLWLPIPVLHYTGVERFRLPRGAQWASMAVVCAGGATYNAGLMVLIGLWGPTTSAVANLLTIALVALADAAAARAWPAWQSVAGAALVCAGFGALVVAGEE